MVLLMQEAGLWGQLAAHPLFVPMFMLFMGGLLGLARWLQKSWSLPQEFRTYRDQTKKDFESIRLQQLELARIADSAARAAAAAAQAVTLIREDLNSMRGDLNSHMDEEEGQIHEGGERMARIEGSLAAVQALLSGQPLRTVPPPYRAPDPHGAPVIADSMDSNRFVSF